MLLDQVYRHRRVGMILVFLFIGLPMVFFIPGAAQFTLGDARDAGFPVAKVGSTKVTAEQFYTRFMQAQDERQRFGQNATPQDLVNDGTVDAILDSLINEALIREQTKNASVHPDDAFLQERMKEDPYFQTEDGQFDAGLYNQWVQSLTRSKFNWDGWYRTLSEQVNQEAYLDLIGASARVTDREVREIFDDQNTKIRIRAFAVAPTVDLTDDQLRAYYDAHLGDFMTPEARVAEYVSISLLPEPPPLVDELIERARGGEDFAALAREYSESLDADSGGDMGWISESPGMREHEKVLFDMLTGEVRGPVRSFMGLHIFTIEETRTDAQGNREVHARQILLRPELAPEEREARLATAKALREAAAGSDGGLLVAAADAGLDVHRTDRISERTMEIEGISEADTFVFRREITKLGMGALSGVIEAQENLFVAKIVELISPTQRTFEDARTDVEIAAIREHKQLPEYQKRLADYVNGIREKAKSIDDVRRLYPELPVEVKETDDFGVGDLLFNQGLYMDTQQIFARLVMEEPGSLTGPYFDMLREPHFIELVDKTVPTGGTWDTQFESEKEEIRKNLLATRELQRRMDYMQYLTAQANESAQIQKDYDAIFQILGLDQKATEAATPLPDFKGPEPDAPSDATPPIIVLDDPAEPESAAEPADTTTPTPE